MQPGHENHEKALDECLYKLKHHSFAETNLEGGRPPLSEVSFISSIGTTKSTLASMIFGLVLGMLPSL